MAVGGHHGPKRPPAIPAMWPSAQPGGSLPDGRQEPLGLNPGLWTAPGSRRRASVTPQRPLRPRSRGVGGVRHMHDRPTLSKAFWMRTGVRARCGGRACRRRSGGHDDPRVPLLANLAPSVLVAPAGTHAFLRTRPTRRLQWGKAASGCVPRPASGPSEQ